MNSGNEWLVDAEGCSPDALRDLNTIRRLCEAVIQDLSLKVLGEPIWHKFGGEAGVTGLYLLTESHLACHTYPETGIATFNLYCCRPRPSWPWETQLKRLIGAARVEVRALGRGSTSAVPVGEQSVFGRTVNNP